MEENTLKENIYYNDISKLFNDFDYRVLKKDDAIQFIEDFFSKNITISLSDTIKLGKVIIILKGHPNLYSDDSQLYENYFLFIYNRHKEKILEIYVYLGFL